MFPALIKDVRSKTLRDGNKEVYIILSVVGADNIAKVVPFASSEVLNVNVDITPTEINSHKVEVLNEGAEMVTVDLE